MRHVLEANRTIDGDDLTFVIATHGNSRDSTHDKKNSETSPGKGESKMSDVIKPRNLWNPVVALRRMGADTSLLSCMVDYFLEDSPLLLRDLKQSIDAGDAPEASRLAHSLRSLCCNIEANDAAQAGTLVEAACVADTLDEASALIPPLTEQVRRLSDVLSMWKTSNPQ